MATMTLTARNVARLAADARRAEYWDRSLPGFGLRVTARGVRTWTIRYRHAGRLCRVTIGRYPTLSLADAREQARHMLRQAGLGQHPAGEKQVARDRQAETVTALITDYESHAKSNKSWAEERRILHHDVLPAWRHRLVCELTRRDVRALVEPKARTAPIMANRLLSQISRLLAFAVEHDWIEANPALRLPKPGGREPTRDRVLTADELRALWAALLETEAKDEHGHPLPRLSSTLNDAFKVLLLTAQRCGEVCRMRWADVDLKTGWWLLPGMFTKNGVDHRVPLSAPVMKLLKTRRAQTTAEAVYVFAGRNSGTSVAARAKRAASHLSRGLPFTFRAHDLRRTAASGMGAAGVPREHIAHILNHRSVTFSTVTAIYDRYHYDAEKRAALDRWASVLLATVSGKRRRQAPVLAFTGRAGV